MMDVMSRSVNLGEFPNVNESNHCRSFPITHPPEPSPLCSSCATYEMAFFDFECESCRLVFTNLNTTISQLFSILRQWTPQVQSQLAFIVNEILRRGANINDKDGLTDLSLLHFAAKAGAQADEDMASRVVSSLVQLGADVECRCRWTDMTPLHYSVYFNVPVVVETLLDNGADINAQCRDVSNTQSVSNSIREICGGDSVLHIAASQLSLEAALILLKRGAPRSLRNSRNQLPIDCLPPEAHLDSVLLNLQLQLKQILSLAQSSDELSALETEFSETLSPLNSAENNSYSNNLTLQSLGLVLNERVLVHPYTQPAVCDASDGGPSEWEGWLRFCGPVQFARGIWAGVELDQPQPGRNNGSVAGVEYFVCPAECGIFTPVPMVSRLRPASPQLDRGSKQSVSATDCSATSRRLTPRSSTPFSMSVNVGRIDVRHVLAKVDTGLRSRLDPQHLEIGCRVLVAGKRKGVIRFIGETRFARGIWYGVELDSDVGKNDGSVAGQRYFTCPARRGIFAPLAHLTKLVSVDGCNQSTSISSSPLHRPKSSRLNPRRPHLPIPPSSSSSSSMLASVHECVQVSSRRSPSTADPSSIHGTAPLTLRVGMQVLCNNEIGVVRFLGKAAFAPGIWLGVELRAARGRNDGSVLGERYFSCRPDHGVMVRPSRVTYRGINGARLIPTELAPFDNLLSVVDGGK